MTEVEEDALPLENAAARFGWTVPEYLKVVSMIDELFDGIPPHHSRHPDVKPKPNPQVSR